MFDDRSNSTEITNNHTLEHEALSKDETNAKLEFMTYVISNRKDLSNQKDLFTIEKAAEFCILYHRSQFRKSGEPYYNHPMEVAKIISVELGLSAKSIAAALLHDTIEDTPLTYKQIKSIFCTEIANLVQGVTRLKYLDYVPRKRSEAQNFKKFILSVSKDLRILIIKFADRLHNMRTIKYLSKRKRYFKAKDTLDIYVPLASRIGLEKIKNELQNLSLEVIDRNWYERILEKKNQIKINKNDFVRNTVQKITKLLQDNDIKANVRGREKSCYSIWMKMMYKNIDFDNISDIFGFRIICESNLDCYKALGVIHLHYKSAPSDRINFSGFDDYISNPKPNGYRSLHTIVFDDKMKIEIQIRTLEMNEEAEFGMIAHWRYKQDKDINYDSYSNIDKKAWVEEMISILNVPGSNLEFLDNYVSNNLSYRSIECIDYKTNHKIYLPHGSNIVDFTYALYPKKAKKLLYAKINGSLVSLSYELVNSDVVEIITATKDTIDHSWHNIAKTFKAKAYIKKYFLSKDNNFYKFEDDDCDKDDSSETKKFLFVNDSNVENYDYSENYNESYDYLFEEEIKKQPPKCECSIELKMNIYNFFPIGVLRIFEENKINIGNIDILEKDQNFIKISMKLESYFSKAFDEIETSINSVSCILYCKVVFAI